MEILARAAAADAESKLYYVIPDGGFGNGEWRM